MRLRTLFYVLLISFVVAVTGYFALRNYILGYAIGTVQDKVRAKYGLNLALESAEFNGPFRVEASKISLVPVSSLDTLLKAEYIGCDLAALRLFSGKVRFDFFSLNNPEFRFVNTATACNYKNLIKADKTPLPNDDIRPTSWRGSIDALIEGMFIMLQTGFEIINIKASVTTDKGTTFFKSPSVKYDLRNFYTSISILDKTISDTLIIKASVLEKNKTYDFEILHPGENRYLPLFASDSLLKLNFSHAKGSIKLSETGNKRVISHHVILAGLAFNHWRLSDKDILIKDAALEGNLLIGEHSVELDSNTHIQCNHIYSTLYSSYRINPDTQMVIKLNLPSMQAQDFFDGLPENMFQSLQGIKAKGFLSYRLNFLVDLTQPDSLIFDSELKGENFRIEKFGKANLSKLNEGFLFDAGEGTGIMRSILVSEENPDFVPFQNISMHLINAVMTSEDGSFMFHQGFNEEAFRAAIAENIKQKKFVRGGSTISMQLVKNCFLYRNKTISRKVEEALLVWLLERNRIVSKERMMEVYLNVIEWGPNVYGIKEAADFYFQQSPSQLTLDQSIFLASLVPHPRTFRHSVDSAGISKPYLQSYYNLMLNKMLARGHITEQDTTVSLKQAAINGRALQLILPKDSMVIDSASTEFDF
ncbi:MAG: transglycosylase domain-containing protein [Bacteroidetes bacterium]|nr:transglycosylase domain-containing protein [Bacteroidota bacterium]